MTKKQIAELVDAIRKVMADIGGDKKKSKQFLIDAGIIKTKKMKTTSKRKCK